MSSEHAQHRHFLQDTARKQLIPHSYPVLPSDHAQHYHFLRDKEHKTMLSTYNWKKSAPVVEWNRLDLNAAIHNQDDLRDRLWPITGHDYFKAQPDKEKEWKRKRLLKMLWENMQRRRHQFVTLNWIEIKREEEEACTTRMREEQLLVVTEGITALQKQALEKELQARATG